ncbi:MFS general substrate transporter [Cerioporus squamosus]|nr:MFS general substrate transporter [Cerioporus squamosus]
MSVRDSQPSTSDDDEKLGVDVEKFPSFQVNTEDGLISEDAHDLQGPTLSPAQERALWRKIDLRFMPIVTLLYLCSFLDRSNIGNAKLQGLESQLHMTGNKYNIALTLYFVVIWGIITTLQGLVKTYPQLVGVRICLGVFEAGLGCGVYYTLSLWYPRYMLQTRIAIFWAGATFAGAFSGLLAYGISFMSGTGGLLGWSWIFIIEGLFTVAIGMIAYFVLPDLPRTAHFLTPEERAYVIHRKKYDNSSVGEEEHFEWRHVKEALLDWQVWALSCIHATISTPVYGIAFSYRTCLPVRDVVTLMANVLSYRTIINGFGFNTAISQLLTVPVYLVAVIMVVVLAIWADRVRMRSPFIFLGLALAAIGYGINISTAPIGVKYFGTFLTAIGGYSAFPATISWVPNNVSGHYKRAVALGHVVIFGNLGGIIGGNVFRLQDQPRFLLGNGLELLFIGIGLILTPAVALTYMRINKKRDEQVRDAQERGVKCTPEELRRMGDRAPDFRYTL